MTTHAPPDTCTIRTEVNPADGAKIRTLVERTAVFRPEEVDVAVELVDARLARGDASGYHFILADSPAGELVAYACFGPIACTVEGFDLFWIAVDPSRQGLGLARRILDLAEQLIARRGGRRVYVETSSTPPYQPARVFYQARGYTLEARLRDFYKPGDDKCIFVKPLTLVPETPPTPQTP